MCNLVGKKFGESKVVEDEGKDFVAHVNHKAGQVSIAASSADNVALSAKDTDGKATIPDLKVFMALAEKAAKEDSIINFGNIRDNEFKARLLIACKEKKVKTQRAPAINEEFLNSLDSASKSRLSALLNKEQYQETPPSSAIKPTTDNEKPVKQPTPAETKATPLAVASRIRIAKEATL